jgi:hypothetical protein
MTQIGADEGKIIDGPQTLAPPEAMPSRIAQIFADLRVKKTNVRGQPGDVSEE